MNVASREKKTSFFSLKKEINFCNIVVRDLRRPKQGKKKEIKGFEKLDVLSELLGFPVWMGFYEGLDVFLILKTLITVNFKQILVP